MRGRGNQLGPCASNEFLTAAEASGREHQADMGSAVRGIRRRSAPWLPYPSADRERGPLRAPGPDGGPLVRRFPSGCMWQGLQGYLVTEFLESSHQIARQALRVEAVEVIGTELMKGDRGAQHVERGDEDGVGDGDDGALFPAARSQTTVLGRQVGVLGSTGRPGGFCETAT